MTPVRPTVMLALFCAAAFASHAADAPPNIVLILADDLGYNDISLHGNTRVRTPNIDAIGRAGVWFTRGHTTAPVCSPSRAGLLTGRNQQRFGFEFVTGPPSLFLGLAGGEENLIRRGGVMAEVKPEQKIPVSKMGIPRSTTNIAELLKQANYATGIFGKWHVGEGREFSPNYRGFDEAIWFTGSLYGEEDDPEVVNAKLEWDSIDKFLWRMLPFRVSTTQGPRKPDEFLTTYQAKKAVDFIERNKDNPFFVYLPFWAPHTPLQAPKKYYDRLGHIADHKTRVYYAMIECMDDAIGMVMAKLEELGLEDNTLVIFSSDNGAAHYTRIANTNQPFRGSKLNLFQGGVVVPYLMKWPKGLPKGKVYRSPVSLMDVYPTVAAAVGTPLPEDETIDGVNLIPFVNGNGTEVPHESLVWRGGLYKAVLSGDYRLQVDENQNMDLLYNIREDISERENLADSQPDRVQQLKTILERAESQFAQPIWTTNFYVPIPFDLWATEPPEGAPHVLFGG